MTNEDRLLVAESKIDVIADNLSGLMRDMIKLVSDKHDIAHLQCQVDSLAAQVSSMSCDLQAVNAVAK